MRWLEHIKSFFSSTQSVNCRMVEINTSSQEVVIHVINRAVYLKTKISEAVADLDIINNLTSSEACWLGGYYGKMLWASMQGRDKIKKTVHLNYLLEDSRAKYQILYQDRSGAIAYIDKTSRAEFLEQPLDVVKSPYIISKFDPAQACYLGILAGINMEKLADFPEKTQDDLTNTNKPPKLRVVQ